MNGTDRAVVEHVAAATKAAGPEAVASAINVHRERLTAARGKIHRLDLEMRAVQRTIAMRELAMRLLAEP